MTAYNYLFFTMEYNLLYICDLRDKDTYPEKGGKS